MKSRACTRGTDFDKLRGQLRGGAPLFSSGASGFDPPRSRWPTRKLRLGPWFLKVLGWLADLRCLRGTSFFDLFSHSDSGVANDNSLPITKPIRSRRDYARR